MDGYSTINHYNTNDNLQDVFIWLVMCRMTSPFSLIQDSFSRRTATMSTVNRSNQPHHHCILTCRHCWTDEISVFSMDFPSLSAQSPSSVQFHRARMYAKGSGLSSLDRFHTDHWFRRCIMTSEEWSDRFYIWTGLLRLCFWLSVSG